MTTLKNYAALLLNALGLLAFFSMVIVISYHHNLRLDLTPGKLYTLSPHTLKILDAVQRPVKLFGFVRKEDPRNDVLRDMFWRISLRQPKITTRVIDLNRNPALAASFNADAYGSVVVESGARRKTFSNVQEEYLMAAILQVTRDYEKTIYVLTGHGERDIKDADRHKGFSNFQNVLAQEFYKVKPLALFGDQEIPKDAAAIAVLGPRRDLLPEEVLKLDRYVSSGGALLVLLDPGASPSVAAFLDRYRAHLPAEIIGESDYQLAAGEPVTARIPVKSFQSTVTSLLDSDPLFSLFGPIDILPGDNEQIDVLPLLNTSSSSWAIPISGTELPQNLQFDPKRGDRRGPFAVGVALAVRIPETKPVRPDESVRRAGRIIVFSDSNFASNQFIDMLGNRDLVVNSVNWLALEDTLIGVRSARKIPGREQFYMSSRQNYQVFLLGVVVLPAAFLVLGAGVFLRRRMS